MKTQYVLNLDSGFAPVSGERMNFNLTQFPGGEPHFYFKDIDKFATYKHLIITQRFNSVADLVHVIIATDAARRMGFEKIMLVLPYFPAARQDRVCNEGESLTVKVFADMINQCKFEKVFIYSPHSEVTPALLDNCECLEGDDGYLEHIVRQNTDYKKKKQTVNIVCPDAGAGKRVGKLAKHIATIFSEYTINLIRCEKIRDVRTGELKEFFVQAEALGGHLTIICDDIVAYGGTFKGLGNVLKEKGAGDLILFTSHADCQAGVEGMAEYFTKFYTTNSKQNWAITGPNSAKLHCFPINFSI